MVWEYGHSLGGPSTKILVSCNQGVSQAMFSSKGFPGKDFTSSLIQVVRKFMSLLL